MLARANDAGDSYLAKWGFAPVDTTPPTLCCPSGLFVIDPLGGLPGEVVSFSAGVSDSQDPSPEVTYLPPSGSLFPRGTTLVTCTATDASGNQSVCQFPVTVQPKVRRR